MEQDKLSIEKVKKIADLCKLDVQGLEQKLEIMFNDTLKYIQVLEELDLKDVLETYQVTGLTNVFQKEGEINETLSNTEALKNADNSIDGLFVTKAVFKR